LHKCDALAGIVKLLVVRDGNPLLARGVEIFRIVISILGRIKTKLDGGRRRIIDGELEVRISIRSGKGVQPDQAADADAYQKDDARDERPQTPQIGLK